MNLQNLLPRIMGFLVIIITLALSPTIYSQNAAILAWTDGVNTPAVLLADFIGLEAIAGFGAFIIIFGLLVGGGMFAISGVRSRLAGATVKDMLLVVGSVIMIVVMLAMFVTVLQYVANLVAAAIADGDSIGEVGFALIPIILYVGIVAAAGWAQASTYRKLRKDSGAGEMKSARAAYV